MILRTEQSSFRDRDGFVFYRDETVYRAIRHSYKHTWDSFSASPFFTRLMEDGKFPAFKEEAAGDFFDNDPEIYKVLSVQKIPFISYPNEWSFGQLKKAALLTLAIQKAALQNNFTLKDASAYNVQFIGPKPVFIDLLSFDAYREGEPWGAYGQFCRHFLGPLLLFAYGYNGLQSLFIDNIDGLPLKLVSDILPLRSKFRLLAYTHIHLHAGFESRHAGDKEVKRSSLKTSKSRTLAIIDHLEQGIRNLQVKKADTNWTGYYDTFSYSEEGYRTKKSFVEKHLKGTRQGLCIDLGANTGEFSELAARHFDYVVACDSDMEVVRAIQAKKTANVLALKTDLASPGPAYGWNNEERESFTGRLKKADTVLALALVHHLCIGNNVPLPRLAAFFAGFAKRLIIEFVPKSDVQVKRLLVTKKDIFADYSYGDFVKSFSEYFHTEDTQDIAGSERVMLVLKRK